MLERIVSTLGPVAALSADLSTLVSERPRLGEPGSLAGDQVDNMNFLFRMQNGVRGTLQVSFTSWFGTGQRFEVYGTEGMLLLARQGPDAPGSTGQNDPGYLDAGELFGARTDVSELLDANRPPETMLQEIQRIPGEDPDDLRESGLAPYGSAYVVRRAFKAFAEAIAKGQRFEPDFRTGMELHRVLEAAELAARDGRWVELLPDAAMRD